MFDTIWEKFEEFCKPQSTEVRARFNLLTSFWQGKKYGTMQSRPRLLWLSTPQKLPRFFIEISFVSFLKIKSLSPKQSMITT